MQNLTATSRTLHTSSNGLTSRFNRALRPLLALACMGLTALPAVVAPQYAPVVMAQTNSINWYSTVDAARVASRSNGKPVMLSFGADWCPWCRRMDRDTFTNASVIAASRNFNCVAIDTETSAGETLSGQYRIESLPTLVFLDASGNETRRLEGFQEASELAPVMESLCPKGINWLTSLSQAQAESRRTGKPILLSFHAEWCPWCRRLERDTMTSAQVTAMANNFIFVKVDTETAEGERLCQEYAVDSYPYLIFFDSRGSITATQEGFCSGSDLAAKMSRQI